jgi:hypothetical protein
MKRIADAERQIRDFVDRDGLYDRRFAKERDTWHRS